MGKRNCDGRIKIRQVKKPRTSSTVQKKLCTAVTEIIFTSFHVTDESVVYEKSIVRQSRIKSRSLLLKQGISAYLLFMRSISLLTLAAEQCTRTFSWVKTLRHLSLVTIIITVGGQSNVPDGFSGSRLARYLL